MAGFNPADMMRLKKNFQRFQADHPRVVAFFQAIRGDVEEGTIVEIKVTTPEGKERITNMRLNPDDVETLNHLIH